MLQLLARKQLLLALCCSMQTRPVRVWPHHTTVATCTLGTFRWHGCRLRTEMLRCGPQYLFYA